MVLAIRLRAWLGWDFGLGLGLINIRSGPVKKFSIVSGAESFRATWRILWKVPPRSLDKLYKSVKRLSGNKADFVPPGPCQRNESASVNFRG